MADQELWKLAEELISSDPDARDRALDILVERDVFRESPLMAYLLATRITDQDLSVRFHVLQALGKILDLEQPKLMADDRVLQSLNVIFSEINRDQLISLLEVAEKYLSAESSVSAILRFCSYAGNALSGIVNDRKTPPGIRIQAVYFCGEVGYLETSSSIENMLRRIKKGKSRGKKAAQGTQADQEDLLLAVGMKALEKLDSGLKFES
jgi:hypothetical protein